MTDDERELKRIAVMASDRMRDVAMEALLNTKKVPFTDAGIEIIKRELAKQDIRVLSVEQEGQFLRFAVAMTFSLWLDVLQDQRERYVPNLEPYRAAWSVPS